MCDVTGASILAFLVLGIVFGFAFVIGGAIARLFVKGGSAPA